MVHFVGEVENNTTQLPKTTKTLLRIKPDTAGLNNKDNWPDRTSGKKELNP